MNWPIIPICAEPPSNEEFQQRLKQFEAAMIAAITGDRSNIFTNSTCGSRGSAAELRCSENERANTL